MTGSAAGAELSVVVVVRNDAERILDCLRSVAVQGRSTGGVEILVIDDGSTDGTPDLIERECPDITLIRKPPEGADLSRNRGIEESNGRIVAFIDSDCVAAPDWVETIVANIRREPGTVVGGRVRHRGPLIRRLVGIADFGEFQGLRRRPVGCLPTCNLAVERSTLGRLRFDPRVANAGGDTVFTEALGRSGAPLVYLPGLVVDHRPEASWAAFMDRAKRYGASFVRARRIDPELRFSGLVRAGAAGVIGATAARIVLDWSRLLLHRRAAGFAIWELPAAAGALAVRRASSLPAALRALRESLEPEER